MAVARKCPDVAGQQYLARACWDGVDDHSLGAPTCWNCFQRQRDHSSASVKNFICPEKGEKASFCATFKDSFPFTLRLDPHLGPWRCRRPSGLVQQAAAEIRPPLLRNSFCQICCSHTSSTLNWREGWLQLIPCDWLWKVDLLQLATQHFASNFLKNLKKSST